MRRTMALFSAVLCLAGLARGQQPHALADDPTAESLRAEIEALRPAHVAWREIAWESCLLEGLQRSREEHKPVLLWVFIDRPADDARC